MRAARLTAFGSLILFSGLVVTPDAVGGYVDCTICHLDPPEDSTARDFSEYFAAPDRQHIVNVEYPAPANSDYRRPTMIDGDITFFDTNGNGVADADEVQLFGATGKIQCASCHREHGDGTTTPEPGMYLRIINQNDALCRVCHDR
jgi:hypothetical protein